MTYTVIHRWESFQESVEPSYMPRVWGGRQVHILKKCLQNAMKHNDFRIGPNEAGLGVARGYFSNTKLSFTYSVLLS